MRFVEGYKYVISVRIYLFMFKLLGMIIPM